MNAASSAEPDFTGRCSCAPPVAAAPPSLPNPPSSTLKNERFIARHMMYERIAPDEPTSDPAMISIGLFSEKPIPAAAEPERDQRHDHERQPRLRQHEDDAKPEHRDSEQQVDHVLAGIHDRRALE